MSMSPDTRKHNRPKWWWICFIFCFYTVMYQNCKQ